MGTLHQFPIPQGSYPSLPDVQCVEHSFVLFCFQIFYLVFPVVSRRKLNLVCIAPCWLEQLVCFSSLYLSYDCYQKKNHTRIYLGTSINRWTSELTGLSVVSANKYIFLSLQPPFSPSPECLFNIFSLPKSHFTRVTLSRRPRLLTSWRKQKPPERNFLYLL